MKKILIICLLFLNCCMNEEDVQKDYSYLEYYQEYQNFDINHYDEYEALRLMYNCSFLEAINYYNYPEYFSSSKNYKSIFKDEYYCLVNKCFYLENNTPSTLGYLKDYQIPYIIRENELMMADRVCLEKLQLMINDMEKQNLSVYLFSGYRSFEKQLLLFNDGDANYVAYPGTSEHQTGLAIDISTLNDGLTDYFEDSLEFKWLYKNSYNYGFILRYPKNSSDITGYSYEPWHFRYVGDIASEIKNETTLEQYLFSNLELPSP